jgi:zinc finger HIT domain-containing protein 1
MIKPTRDNITINILFFPWFGFVLFFELTLILQMQANLESLPPHVPSYWKAAVGPPSSTARRHFCTVCGFSANYTCVRCGVRFCSNRCQNVHNDTRCLKFVA